MCIRDRFCAVAKASVATGITACVLPFIPTAIIKAILASVIGFEMCIRDRVLHSTEEKTNSLLGRK